MSKSMEMIERVREGEDAKVVVEGIREGKEVKEDSEGLRERTERLLRKNTRKR